MLYLRFKAFIVDMFMIMMPISYVVTYVFFGSKEALWVSQFAGTIIMITYALIIILFWHFKAQTPGMRAYNLILVNNTLNKKIQKQTKIHILICIYRYILFIFAFVFPFLLLVSFFRKDRKTIYDLLSKTHITKQ